MSFDLLVFDPQYTPSDDAEFLEWYKRFVQWDETENDYSSLTQTTVPLKKFYTWLSKTYPPMNHIDGGIDTAINMHEDDDLDEACITEYVIGKHAIYLQFSWSVAEEALRATLDAALKEKVGFWNVSETGSMPLRLPKDIKKLLSQLNDRFEETITNKDVFNFLKEKGWMLHRDPDGGSRFATLSQDDKVFEISPRIRKSSNKMTLYWGENVIPARYLEAVSIINDEKEKFFPLKIVMIDATLEAEDIKLSDVRSDFENVFKQLQQRDMKAELQEVSELPLSMPGNWAISILAAKACLGHYEELCNICKRMKQGDRQGFVPYVEIGHIERAIKACMQLSQADPDL